jgi:putative transposase
LYRFSRQAYYQHSHRQIKGEEADKQILDLIEAVRKDHPQMGGKKLSWALKEELGQKGIKMSWNALVVLRLNQVWVADITYWLMEAEFCTFP